MVGLIHDESTINISIYVSFTYAMWMKENVLQNDINTHELRELGSLSQNPIKRLLSSYFHLQ
jgi:hypothetical protein